MNAPAQPARADLRICNAAQTAALIDFEALMKALAQAAAELDAGAIRSPERLVVPLTGGVLLSMPATANDIAIHKLVNVVPGNAQQGLPTIHGIVTVCDAATGRPLVMLDGPEVTGRRTAAVSMLAVRRLLGRTPAEVLMIGTGAQARYHLALLGAVCPKSKIWVRGISAADTEAFCRAAGAVHSQVLPCPTGVPDAAEAVITLTTATEPVYDEAARAGRVVVGVGAFKPEMAEIGKTTLDGSALYADDPAGARHEAGDLLRAGIDWARVRSLGSLLANEPERGRPAVFKSVGTAAWDLAASRVALQALGLAR